MEREFNRFFCTRCDVRFSVEVCDAVYIKCPVCARLDSVCILSNGQSGYSPISVETEVVK